MPPSTLAFDGPVRRQRPERLCFEVRAVLGGIGIFLYIGGADVFQRIVAAGDVVQPFVEAASQFVGAHVADVELGDELVDLVNSMKIGCCASG